jgi:hypothetical protein
MIPRVMWIKRGERIDPRCSEGGAAQLHGRRSFMDRSVGHGPPHLSFTSSFRGQQPFSCASKFSLRSLGIQRRTLDSFRFRGCRETGYFSCIAAFRVSAAYIHDIAHCAVSHHQMLSGRVSKGDIRRQHEKVFFARFRSWKVVLLTTSVLSIMLDKKAEVRPWSSLL